MPVDHQVRHQPHRRIMAPGTPGSGAVRPGSAQSAVARAVQVRRAGLRTVILVTEDLGRRAGCRSTRCQAGRLPTRLVLSPGSSYPIRVAGLPGDAIVVSAFPVLRRTTLLSLMTQGRQHSGVTRRGHATPPFGLFRTGGSSHSLRYPGELSRRPGTDPR